VHFASYYRWLVATRRLKLPTLYTRPLLEIGAHNGEWLARIKAPLRVGVDLRSFQPSSVALVQASGLELPFSREAFGDVWLFDVLEHVADDQQLIREALRMLIPGGDLWLSTTADCFWILPGGRLQGRLERSWGHVRRGYTRDRLLALIDPGVRCEIFDWPEVTFRYNYLLMWLCARGSPAFARMLANLCYQVDSKLQLRESSRGHLYLHARPCSAIPRSA
jgi:SAM-dependent methyltransferase